ncbi:hypothetical protein PSJ8397_00943 [Pseudooctadecabacter jejudonensis]|uniref:Uncharacterized protein n=1 Tax=Pseudooctadecabacter jejudonensis TaxID=1391910 RepID=A0A1Y5RQ63_9RHOB|nr:hypothetical protein PSJ8397_00943 [Pseudooctadecabacter jejudonensis]
MAIAGGHLNWQGHRRFAAASDAQIFAAPNDAKVFWTCTLGQDPSYNPCVSLERAEYQSPIAPVVDPFTQGQTGNVRGQQIWEHL